MGFLNHMSNFLSQFHYSVLGDPNNPKKIVFIHGLMAFAANWRKIASRMENDYQCLIYDQRGHGRSFKPETGYSTKDFALDLDKITDELGWTEFHVIGHSMGARNAMVFGHLFPQKVLTLTLEDMGPEANEKALGYYKRMLESIPTPFATKEHSKRYFENSFAKNFRAKEPLTVLSTFLQANLEEKTTGPHQGMIDWKFSKDAIYEIVELGNNQNHWLEVSSFKMPVLTIRGENSHVLSRETFEKMQTVNPNIRGVEIAGAGHWVHYEKSDEFAQALKDFINGAISLHDA